MAIVWGSTENLPEVTQGAEIAQHHARDGRHLLRRGRVRVGRVPGAHLPRGKPAQRADNVHGGEAQRVVYPRVATGLVLVLARHDARDGVKGALAPERRPALRAGAGGARRRPPASQQGLVLGHVGARRLGPLARQAGAPHLVV
jgi:hypothetical protein